jgi:hypothetical protein
MYGNKKAYSGLGAAASDKSADGFTSLGSEKGKVEENVQKLKRQII